MAAGAAELFPRHAFLDLETTGLDPLRDEVIEVGVAFVERGEIVRRLGRLFRPSRPLPAVIRRLTGLNDAMLAGEAPFADFAAELKGQLGGWTLVAHNAGFERAFLSQSFGGPVPPMLDTCELLHLLHPELPSHALDAVVRWAKVGTHVAHRALEDAEDTFLVAARALEGVLGDVRTDDVADLLAVLAPPGTEPPPEAAPLLALLDRLLAQLKGRRARLSLEPTSDFLPPPSGRQRRPPGAGGPPGEVAGLEQLFAADGPLAKAVPRFHPRPAQREMAAAVARTLEGGGTLALEAGTGTGKSLAYLAPAALHAARTGEKVAVAPHTRALQDQLVEKELPRLHEATGGAFGFAVLKGQTNYLCRRRALDVTRPQAECSWDDRAARAYLRAFLRRSPDGDLDRLSYWFREQHPALGPLVEASRSEAATTLGERCPHHAWCFYHSAVAQARDADVLVVNQSLALAWPSRYPKLDHLVLDEAHELEDVATAAWTKELSGTSLGQLADRLAGRWGLLPRLARESAPELAAGLTRAASDLVLDLKALEAAVRALAPARVEGGSWERRLTPRVRASRGWVRVRDALRGLADTLLEAQRLLQEAARARGKGGEALQRELSGALEAVRSAAALAEELAGPPRDGWCDSAQARADGFALLSQPVDVGPEFHARLLAKHKGVVLTSATLSTAFDRPWVLERLGLTKGKRAAELLRYGTAFDLPAHALVVLVTDAPEATSDEFVDWAAQRISGLARFLGGRLLGLFASRARLDAVGALVRRELEPSRIEVLLQQRGTARQLAARQEQDAGTVLLGTRAFWQGVDIPGPGVACVFIDKLPLEPFGRPLVEAREEALGGEAKGFLGYRLPKALLLLRQGVGRLLRSAKDRGVVVLADPGSASYRAQLYAALEGYRVEALGWGQARVRVFQALRAMGLGAEQRDPAEPARPTPPVQGALFEGP